ncbi:hypothetical protein FSP39_007983 [Pinctada imbricata]|uniref:EGF-like domain-containing protein n=1 Tax=Pinctada imbricata TaxID=66713 RepID=A0AA88XKS2_PINIB|nr:hypothetical protein FSP39_007983 [Pinctada imbricata]
MSQGGKNYTMLRDETTAVKYLRVYDISSRSGSNACSKQNGNCSQLCIPTGPNMRDCRCTAGYRRLNTIQCSGIEKFLIYTSDTEIRGLSFDSSDKSEALPLISRIKKAGSVDFHADGDHIYWVDKTSSVEITRIKRDLTGRETIISEEESDVTSIAVDWIAGHLYWTDAQQKIIEVVKVDNPSVRYIILYTDLEYPTSVIVDPLKGKVYWIDSGRFPKIEMANLDGSGRMKLVENVTIENSDKQGWVGLAKDFNDNKLYWCDNIEEKLMVFDLAWLFLLGENFAIITSRRYFYYYRAIDTGVIRAVNKNTKTVTTGWTGLSPNMHSLRTFDSSIQTGSNPCKVNNGECKDLCFYDGKSVTCACSYGVLTEDGKDCTDHDSFLFYSKVTSIESLHMHEDMNPPKPPIDGASRIRNVIGLAVDYPNKRVFFSDIQQGNIQVVDFDGKNIQLVVKSVGSAEGIAYDEFSNFLYWTSYSDSTINRKLLNFTSKVTNDSLKETVITLSSNDHPRAIVLDACSQRMFWTNWNDFHPTIQRAFFSGYNATSIITKDIRTPNGLTIDHKAQRLYWSDARLDKIERCDFDGNNREIIVTTIPQHSFGLALYGEYLYWTDWMRRAVVRANKHDGNIYTYLRKGLQRQPMGIAVVAEDANDCTTNPCLNNILQCEGKCQVTPRHVPYCKCEPPKVLAEDGVRCIRQELHCGVNDFVCHDGSKCFPRIQVCNGVTDCLDGSDEFRAVCNKEECGPGFYTCKNHQCASLNSRCDGTPNCMDGSDEKDCLCQEGQFKCVSEDKCVDNKFVCDFDPDCIDHSDEMGCNIDCSKEEIFANEGEVAVSCNLTSQCILPSWICDGKMDCYNNTDELNCPNETNCSDSGFQCNDGACIPLPWRCDGDVDCPDNSDEGEECDQLCLPQSWQCDSYPDCPNGTDELESICSNRTCKDDEFLCSGGRCIPGEWKCDGDPDCPNNEDEGPEQGCQPPECGDGEYQCQNMKCIKKIFYCDGEDDCGDGSDEPSTCRRIECDPGLFQCGSLCLRQELVCDGHTDCMHGEDEKNCSVPCGKNDKNHYLCGNGVCIQYNLTCNGRNDCGDSSDEPENCHVNECQSSTNKCNQKCKDRNIGYECECHDGFKLAMDKHRCEDINECSSIYPCSHFCINTVGSYKCHCAEGYQLDTNGIICKTVGSYKPFLILANRYYLRNISFSGHNLGSQTIIVRNLKNAVAVDFDVKEEFIYWSEITSNSSTINRMNITESQRSNYTNVNVQVLHSSTLKNPDGLAVDWVGRNLYWCDKTTDTIEVSRLDGKYRRVIIKEGLHEPRALEVFPAKGLLFFSDWGDTAHISRANMDGTNLRTILSDKLAWPNALTIDYVTEKIFWGDANYNYIAFADLDGKNMHTVLDQNLPHIFSMTTFMDHIFWTDWEDMSIQRADKFSGLNRQTIASLIHRPMDLHVYHPMRQASVVNNPCDKLSCSHLCLLKPNPADNRTLTAVCSCPENHILQADGTCKSNCTSSQFLCQSSSKCIPSWWKCDGQKDCDDGADEPSNCPQYYCDQKDRFQCKNATSPKDCILPVQICNGKPNCADKSDEQNCENISNSLQTSLPVNQDLLNVLEEMACAYLRGSYVLSRTRTVIHNYSTNGVRRKSVRRVNSCAEVLTPPTKTQQDAVTVYLTYGCATVTQIAATEQTSQGNCNILPCREGYRKCAKKGRCVPNSWWCDGDVDCGYTDDSDENSTECEEKQCQSDQMRCDNNHCIPKRWRCDHDNDCKDGSDEKNCTDEDYRNCSDSEFRCDNNRCIPQSMQCDGEYNCEDSSDERNCSNVACNTSTEFSCSSMCIPISWKCDEEIDCPGGEDERSCQENFTCPPGMFMCKDHKCIYGNKRCNGQNDCSDGSDEKNCFWDHICSSREFKCQKSNKCIGMDKVCDKKSDCPDGQDEGPLLCNSTMSTSCGPNSCQHHCVYYKRIRNFKCTCKTGYQLKNNGYDCEAVNLCAKWGTCSQRCEKTSDRFLCRCEANYILDILSDKVTTCSAIGYKPEILLAHENNLIKSSIQKGSQGGQQEVVSQANNINTKIEAVDGFMMDQGGSWKIFTVNRGTTETTIRSFDMTVKGSRKKRESASDPIVRGLAEPTGIAVDWIGQHIYWADAQTNKIEMSKFDGSMRRAVVSIGVDEPQSLAVEPKIGKLYWTDRGYPPKISSSNLDGSGKKDLVKSDIIWPNGLAIDYPNQRLYWTDMKKRTVETVDLTGKDRHIVRTFNISNPPYMIDVFEDFLYVSLYKNHTIVKIHKFNNSHITDSVMFSNMQYIGDIVILHPSKQKQNISNACKSTKDNGSELCPKALCINMPSLPGDKNYTCVCPDDAIHNGHGCEFALPCNKNVCQNNGTCKNSGGKDKCLCTVRYSGEQCQIDRCMSYCLNDGTCQAVGANLVCNVPATVKTEEYVMLLTANHNAPSVFLHFSCVKGYSGEKCENQLSTPAGQSSPNRTTMLVAIIIPIIVCLIIFIIVIIVVCFKRRRDQFKHHQLSNSNVEVANPVYLQRGDHSTDDDDKENEPLDQNFDFEDHDDAVINPMYNPIYKADSTQVLLPKGSRGKENMDSNGSLHNNHIVKDKRSKNKGKSKKSSS